MIKCLHTQTPSSPDYTNYLVNSVATPFIEDSLRVYINGIRLSSSDWVYVPGPDGPDDNWTLTSFTPDHTSGSFEINRTLDSSDIVRIDYNTTF